MSNKNEDWEEFIKGVKPLNKANKITPEKKKDYPIKLRNNIDIDSDKELFVQSNLSKSIKSNQLPEKNFKRKIQSGIIKIDATLDLHGKKYKESKEEVYDFIKKNFFKKKRLLLIITGKGKRLGVEDGWQGSGVLMEDLPKWLSFEKLNENILWFEDAPSSKGGRGAKLIYLRKFKE